MNIYLCGGMTKFGKDNYDEGNEWRVFSKNVLENTSSADKIKVINPNDYFNFHDDPPRYATQREIMNFDLNKVRSSDLIICNFNDMYSLGSMAELAIAYDRNIPVIGLSETNEQLHPWQTCICERIFDDINEMLDYVIKYYLN